MAKEKFISPKEFGAQLGLSRDQMIYRLRRNDIKNIRPGWGWAIPESELTRVPETDWYKESKKADAVA